MKLTLEEVASLCNGKLVGDANKIISGVSTIESASSFDIVYVSDSKHKEYLIDSKAGAVFVSSDISNECGIDFIEVENPKLAFALVADKLNPQVATKTGISGSAHIDSSVNLPDNLFVGAHTSIGRGVELSPGVRIGDGCRIGDNVVIGINTILHENVVIKNGSRIGCECRIHPGVVIGADGFGLVKAESAWVRIPQLGNVVIGDNVDIGANTTIDRGSLRDTKIDSGVKLDNLIQIGHNVEIGENTVVAAHTAIAGSSKIGKNCEIGGCVGIMDHSTIGNNIKIGGGSVVSGTLTDPGIYSSSIKAAELSVWQKNVARLRNLDNLADRVRKLEKK